MGQFSWFTQDTDKQIGSEPENTITVYMYDDKGNRWKEENYEGYGRFGGKDFYDLLAEMNGFTKDNVDVELREKGIDLYFGDDFCKDECIDIIGDESFCSEVNCIPFFCSVGGNIRFE